MARFKPPGQCPNCGEWVPRGALACGNCGSCAKSGWSQEADEDGLDLPTDDFDYDEFIATEFGQRTSKSPAANREAFWRAVGVVLLIVMLIGWLLSAL